MPTTTTTTGVGGGSRSGGGGDENKVLETAQRIVQSLNSSRNVDTQDMLHIFSSFDNRLSNISLNNNNHNNNSKTTSYSSSFSVDDKAIVDPQFESAESIILNFNGDEGLMSANEDYLYAVDEIIYLNQNLNVDDHVVGLADRVETALQMAMARLEDEFRHVLIQNTVPLQNSADY